MWFIPTTILDDIVAARKTSMPAPEPKSTTVSPFLIRANLVGILHPTLKMDDWGMDSSSVRL
jgi:hypothetical protein